MSPAGWPKGGKLKDSGHVADLIWSKEGSFGAEFAEVTMHADRLNARGVAIRAAPLPYRLNYGLRTTSGWITSQLRVQTSGAGWWRFLYLERSADGVWSCTTKSEGRLDAPPPGGDASSFGAAVDCDLGECPLTNTMPVMRSNILAQGGEPIDITAALVSVPDLSVHPSPQRYSFARQDGAGVWLSFESGSFEAEIEFDQHGLVRHYPGLAHRVAPP
ncbi:MAG: putative glycolipid-binding domain-containing protein [Actinomycetota bacterium]|nr:putative glycolipid-binding domain-containing protein [Actinomycetota bacterium]